MSEGTGGRMALAEALFRIGALRFGKSTLASGETASYRLDLSILPSDPEAFALAVTAYQSAAKEIGEENFDAFAGATAVGLMVSAPLAYALRKPLLHAQVEEKERGPGRRVEGVVRPGWRVLVIDDVVASGERIISLAEALRSSGCVVKAALVLVDRFEGGKDRLAAQGVRLNSFTDVRDLTELLFGNRRITKADYESALKQIGERPA